MFLRSIAYCQCLGAMWITVRSQGWEVSALVEAVYATCWLVTDLKNVKMKMEIGMTGPP